MALNGSGQEQEVVFFTICTEDFFIGLVALINSLRLVGHTERIVVLDCGLSDEQLALLEGYCETVKPLQMASNATLYKGFGHAMNPRGVSVIIDSDMIVTGRLDPAIEAARDGKISVCNDPEADRWFSQWREIFALEGKLRREPYVNAGFVVLSSLHWPDLLMRWWALCERLFSQRVHYHGLQDNDPIAQADQDALNAMLMSEIGADKVARLPGTAVAHCSFERAKVVDLQSLACSKGGEPTLILHWPGQPKPWAWRGIWAWRGWTKFSNRNPYIVLLRRLLIRDDIAIRIPDVMLPMRLGPGVVGAATFVAQGTFSRLMLGPARSGMRLVLGRK